MRFSKLVFPLVAGAVSVSAHMRLSYPAPFKAANNPHTQGEPDNKLHFPHNCCGDVTPLPCRGYLKLLGTDEGAPVATWQAGSLQQWSIMGPPPEGGTHWGGSCQVGFSVDKGKTFRVAMSYEGNCPHRTGTLDPSTQTFPFNVLADLPDADVVFAWTWMNREQEFFMNCAAVTITQGLGSEKAVNDTLNHEDMALESEAATAAGNAYNKLSSPMLDVAVKHKRSPGERAQRFLRKASKIPFSDRPAMLFANVNNGCLSPKTTMELKYPNPGPDVTEGDGVYPLGLPSGTC